MMLMMMLMLITDFIFYLSFPLYSILYINVLTWNRGSMNYVYIINGIVLFVFLGKQSHCFSIPVAVAVGVEPRVLISLLLAIIGLGFSCTTTICVILLIPIYPFNFGYSSTRTSPSTTLISAYLVAVDYWSEIPQDAYTTAVKAPETHYVQPSDTA